jgi:hypothetical protein
VATVDDTGAPVTARGWGVPWSSPDGRRLRLLLDPRQLPAGDLRGRRIAVTAAEVRTYRAIQHKGRVAGPLAPATEDDLAAHAAHIAAFTAAVVETDGTDPRLIERLVPDVLVACEVDVEARFDQTPGPRAGRAVERSVPE